MSARRSTCFPRTLGARRRKQSGSSERAVSRRVIRLSAQRSCAIPQSRFFRGNIGGSIGDFATSAPPPKWDGLPTDSVATGDAAIRFGPLFGAGGEAIQRTFHLNSTLIQLFARQVRRDLDRWTDNHPRATVRSWNGELIPGSPISPRPIVAKPERDEGDADL